MGDWSRVILLGLALLGASTAQAAALPSQARGLLSTMGVPDTASVRFEDEAGRPLSAERFFAQTNDGKEFSLTKRLAQGARPDVVFRLQGKEPAPQAAPGIQPGKRFPYFHAMTLRGDLADNAALLGRPAVGSFYFAACAPCVREVPQLNALATRRPDLGYLAVTFDPIARARAFVTATGLRWPVVADAATLAGAAGVQAYPTLMLLDPAGRVLAVQNTTPPEGLDAWIDRLLPPALQLP